MPEPILEQIVGSTLERVASRKRAVSISDLEARCDRTDGRDFFESLDRAGISVIAEIKRMSPSEGSIRLQVDPAEIARQYEEAGASALSVLTETDFFEGSIEDLVRARDACLLPVLQKDFLVDPYQVMEAKALGADAVLLILSALEPVLYKDLYQTAEGVGLSVLAEVHDEYELDLAMAVEPSIIGINQRNLRTFDVDNGIAIRLRPRVPSEVLVVAESGISTNEQVLELQQAGVDAVLVGTSLLRAKHPGSALHRLLGGI